MFKPDLVDNGAEEEVLEVLRNHRKPLALGYVLVKNRNQSQLKSGMSLSESLLAEEKYLSEHEQWGKLPATCRGVRALSSRLTQVYLISFAKFYYKRKLTCNCRIFSRRF